MSIESKKLTKEKCINDTCCNTCPMLSQYIPAMNVKRSTTVLILQTMVLWLDIYLINMNYLSKDNYGAT